MHISMPIATLAEVINEGGIPSRHGIPEDPLGGGVPARPAAAFEKMLGREFTDFALPPKGRSSLPASMPERYEQAASLALSGHSANEDHPVPVAAERGSVGFSGPGARPFLSRPAAALQMNGLMLAADGQARDQGSADHSVSHATTHPLSRSGKMPEEGVIGDGENVPTDLPAVFLVLSASGEKLPVQPASVPPALPQDPAAKPAADIPLSFGPSKESDPVRSAAAERIPPSWAGGSEYFGNREMRLALPQPSADDPAGGALVADRSGQGKFFAEHGLPTGSLAENAPRNRALPASAPAMADLILPGFQKSAELQGDGSGGAMTTAPLLAERSSGFSQSDIPPMPSSGSSGGQGAVRAEDGSQQAVRQVSSGTALQALAADAAPVSRQILMHGPATEPVTALSETGASIPVMQASARITGVSAETGGTTGREVLPVRFDGQIAADAAGASEVSAEPISQSSERPPLQFAEDGMTHGRIPEATGMNRSHMQHGLLPIERHAAYQIAMAAAQFSERPVELVLSPEELGRVRITLSLGDNNAITVSIVADRPDTLDLMRRNIPALAQEFRDIGYQNASFSFGPGSGEKGGLPQAHGSAAAGSSSSSVPEESDVSAPPSSATLVLDPQDRLDLRL